MKTLLLSICLLFTLSSCATKFVKFTEKGNDVFPSENLRKFLKNTPAPKVVIRTTDQRTKVVSGTYSEKSKAFGNSHSFGSSAFGNSMGTANYIETEISYENLYNVMEREFMRNGFVVRDRQLFDQIVSNNDNTADYSKLKEKSDTDIIVEVSRIDMDVLYETNKYYTDKGREGVMNYDYKRYGTSIEFKVILIENNELAGTYTFNYTPCNEKYPCIINEKFEENWRKAKKGKIGYERVEQNQVEEFVKFATNHLIQTMRG